jgi:hypothetical protein
MSSLLIYRVPIAKPRLVCKLKNLSIDNGDIPRQDTEKEEEHVNLISVEESENKHTAELKGMEENINDLKNIQIQTEFEYECLKLNRYKAWVDGTDLCSNIFAAFSLFFGALALSPSFMEKVNFLYIITLLNAMVYGLKGFSANLQQKKLTQFEQLKTFCSQHFSTNHPV